MNIAWIIVILIFTIYLQANLYQKWGLSKITYQRSFDKTHVFANKEVEMIDQIANEKILPLPWVRLEAKINKNLRLHQVEDEVSDDREFHRTIFSLLPYQKVTRRHRLTCLKRGVFRLQTVALTCGDLLGFQEEFAVYETNAVLTVYPELIMLEELPLPAHRFLGDQTVKRWIMEDPFLTIGTRGYQNTDPAHTINWKASARTNQMQVNVHDYTADHELIILFNADQSEDSWLPTKNEGLFEQAMSYAATVAHYALGNGEKVGFHTNAVLEQDQHLPIKPFVRIEANSGNNHCYYILEKIAQLTYLRSRNFHYLLEAYREENIRQTDFLLITNHITEQMMVDIEALRQQGNVIEILRLDEYEREESA